MLVHNRDDTTPAQGGGSVAEFQEDIRVRYALALVEGTSADIPNKCKIADEDASVPDLVEHYGRDLRAASHAFHSRINAGSIVNFSYSDQEFDSVIKGFPDE